MSKLSLNKYKLGIMLAISLTASSLTGCSIEKMDPQTQYEITLEDMSGYEDAELMAYLSDIPYSDENFRAAVYNYIAENPLRNTIMAHSVAEATVLDISNINNITDIRLYRDLKSLTIRESNITDYSALSNLKLNRIEFHNMDIDCSLLSNINVSSIDFIDCNLTNIEQLPNNIEYLGISYCHGGSLSNIGNMKHLKGVNLNNADVTDYEALANTNITTLNINDCHLDNWDFLNQITSLKELDVSFTNFDNMSYVTNLSKLETLAMAYDHIDSLNGIENLTKLENVNLESCVRLDTYEQLTSLPKLQYADLANLEMIYSPSVINQLQSKGVQGFETMDDQNIKDQVDALYESIGITDNMSDEEKVNRICLKVQEVIDIPEQFDSNDIYNYSRNILGSGLKGYGVCNTFSGLTNAFLKKAGLNCYVMIGESIVDNENYLHVWNIVEIDGKWYGIDNTFMEEVDNAYQNLSEGKDSIYYLDSLDDSDWMQYHHPYWNPAVLNEPHFNLAK